MRTIHTQMLNTLYKTADGSPVSLRFSIVQVSDTLYTSHIDTVINGQSYYNRRPAQHTNAFDASATRKERLARTDKAMAAKAAKHGGVWPTPAKSA